MNDQAVVVVGGGISGLAAAHALASSSHPPRITVLESSLRVGGKLAGARLDGVPVDLGAESLLATRPEAVDLVKAVGLSNDLVHPATTVAGLWVRDRIRAIPPTVMGVPIDPDATTDVLGAEAAARVRHDADLPAPALTEDVAIGKFVAERMGQAVTDRLIDPLLGGVYAGQAEQISMAAAVPELYARLRTAPSLLAATAQLRPVRRGDAKTPVFAGVRGGIHRLVDALEADLVARGVQIRTADAVRGIRRTTGGYEVESGPVPAPELTWADAVIVAAPATAASRMLADVVPAASVELAAIEYASMAVVTVAVPRRDWPDYTTGSGFLVPSVEGRTIKGATYSHAKWKWLDEAGGDLAVFRCSVGRFGEEQVLQHSDEELVALVLADLQDAIGLKAQEVAHRVTRWGEGLPQYAVGHLDRIDRLEAAVADVPGLAVCGAAYRGVGIPACIASGQRAATQVQTHLATTMR